MANGMAPTSSIPLSLATVSIGYAPSHTLPHKISAIAGAGFKGLELGMPDLVSFAEQHLHHAVSNTDYTDLVASAKVVKAMCDAKGLEVMLLQPFTNFEGWREGTDEHRDAWDRVEGWIKILKAVGCKTLQVGSSDTPADHPSWNGKREYIIKDLRQLADRLDEDFLKLAYENWCWSTHAPDWTSVWEIVKAVDRTNIGLCLDTFQSAGGEWADPTTESGLIQNKSKDELDQMFKDSMDNLSKTIPANKIFLLQISDAYKTSPPIPDRLGDNGLRPRGQWSKAYRPVPFAHGAYLPVAEMAKGVLGTGFRGWFSVEIFDQGPEGKGKEYDLDEFARSCMNSTKDLTRRCEAN